jgi:transposase
MSSPLIIAPRPRLRIMQVTEAAGIIQIEEISESPVGQCPACGQRSRRTWGGVWRTVWTTPWGQRPPRRRIRLRRFQCPNPQCPRKTFVERLPDVAPRQRRTTSFAQ